MRVSFFLRVSALLWLLACAAPPPADVNPAPHGDKAVLDALEARAKEVLSNVDHPVDRASWEKAVPRLRQELRASLGLSHLPEAKPRNVRTVGTIDRGTYRI